MNHQATTTEAQSFVVQAEVSAVLQTFVIVPVVVTSSRRHEPWLDNSPGCTGEYRIQGIDFRESREWL